MQSLNSTSLFRFITVFVFVLFFASSSLATPDSRASSSTCVTHPNQLFAVSRAATTVAKVGASFSSRAGLFAEALNDIAKTSIRGGARTLKEVLVALKGTNAVLGDVIEAASRCNACISRTQTALRGLNKTLGLKGKEALEKIGDWAKKFTSGVSGRIDDFMYSVLNTCVGAKPSAKVIEWCEQVVNWRAAGGKTRPPLLTIACPRNSFDALTPVFTKFGLATIASLSVGNNVLAFNEQTRDQNQYEIQAVHRHQDQQITRLTLEADQKLETIITTPGHPFYLEKPDSTRLQQYSTEHDNLGANWVDAGLLHSGDVLRRADGHVGIVRVVETRVESREMYNLTVDTAHTFFVGRGGWLVHNATVPLAVPCYPNYKQLKSMLKGSDYQANHLNQNAAFSYFDDGRIGIPEAEGVANPLRGDAFNDVGSEHFIFHAYMENFWDTYRRNGSLFGDTPDLVTYNQSVREALTSAGIEKAEVDTWILAMEFQQSQFATVLVGKVPRIPGKLPQKGR
jgi:hypothetical protein